MNQGNPRYRLNPDEEQLILNHRYGSIEMDSAPLWLSEMPDGKDEIEEHINVYGTTAILCDIHLGYHDIDAIKTCIKYLQKEKIDSIVLNGDTVDAHRLSRWAKRKDDIEFTTELQLARNFIDNLKATFPKAQIYFKVGNHEDRLERYIQDKADEFAGLITWQSLLKLDEKGIKFVDSNQLMLCNNTWIAHGHELKVSGGQNPANALLNKTYTNSCMGHLHKTHTITRKTLEGSFIRCDVIGTLSKLKRAYLAYSNSNHGFAIIDEDGTMNNLRIEDGKVFA
jgi:metallophosphoesterase superfamily enzyme